jgi:L-fuculose-phosphate aldolase
VDQKLNTIRNEIIEVGKRAYSRGFVAANDGNISTRIGKNRILITPANMSKGFMKNNDLIIVDIKGNVVEGKKKPSSEMRLHLQIYQNRSDVMSVCHLHPPYATTFAVAGIPLDQPYLSEAIISLGSVALVPYGTPGTEEVSRNLSPLLQSHDVFLLANHGALTVGKNVFDAYFKMETLEHVAKIIFLAKQIGSPVLLTANQVSQLETIRKKLESK